MDLDLSGLNSSPLGGPGDTLDLSGLNSQPLDQVDAAEISRRSEPAAPRDFLGEATAAVGAFDADVSRPFGDNRGPVDPRLQDPALRRLETSAPPLPGRKPPVRGLAADVARAGAQGALQTTATAAETFAANRERAQRRLATFQARVEQAGALDDAGFRRLLQDIASEPELPATLKGELTTAAREVRQGRVDAAPDIAGRFEGNIARDIERGLSETAEGLDQSEVNRRRLTFDLPLVGEVDTLQVVRDASSTAPFLAARALTGPLGLAAFSIASGQGEALQRAAANGASDPEQARAQLLGTLPGATDIAPIENLFRAAPIAPGLKGALAGIARAAVRQGLIEGTQEGVQEFLQNAIERVTTDESQDLLENVPEGARTGALVGVLFGTAGGGAQATARQFEPGDGAKRVTEEVVEAATEDQDLPEPGALVTFRRPDGSAARGRVLRPSPEGVGVVVEPEDQPGAQEFVGRRLIRDAEPAAPVASDAAPASGAAATARADAAAPRAAEPVDITPEDEASPIPTELIAEGKAILREAEGAGPAPATARGPDQTLDPATRRDGATVRPAGPLDTEGLRPVADGDATPAREARPATGAEALPAVGSEVAATLRDGTEVRGRVVDQFEEPRARGRTAPALTVETEQGPVNVALDRDQVRPVDQAPSETLQPLRDDGAAAGVAPAPEPPPSPRAAPGPAAQPPASAEPANLNPATEPPSEAARPATPGGLEPATAASTATPTAAAPPARSETLDPVSDVPAEVPATPRRDRRRPRPRVRGGKPRVQQQARRPVSAVRAIVNMGGIRDDQREVRLGLGISARQRPGLINMRDGLPLDEIGLRLHELGFFPTLSREEITDGVVLEVIDEEVNRGRKLFRPDDVPTVEEETRRMRALNREAMEAEATELGIPQASIDRLSDDDLSAAVVRERDIQTRQVASETETMEDEVDAIVREALAEEGLNEQQARDALDDDIPFFEPVSRRNLASGRRPAVRRGAEDRAAPRGPSEGGGRAAASRGGQSRSGQPAGPDPESIRDVTGAAQAGFDFAGARNPFFLTSEFGDAFEAGRFLARQGAARPESVRKRRGNVLEVDGQRLRVDGESVQAVGVASSGRTPTGDARAQAAPRAGGDFDRAGDQRVNIGDLVRDRQFDAPQGLAREAAAGRDNSTGDAAPGNRPSQPETELTDQGEQQLIEGVRPVTDRDRAEARGRRALRSEREQQDFGETPLGDVQGRGQGALFSAPDPNPDRDVAVVRVEPRFSGLPQGERRRAARRFARDELRGREVRNRETGQTIAIGAAGIDKATSGVRSGADLDVLTKLPELLENAVQIDQRPDRRARRGIQSVKTFLAAADIDGRLHRVRLTVRQAADGNFFYDQHVVEVGASDVVAPGRPGREDRVPFGGPPEATVKLGDLRRDVNPDGSPRFAAPPADDDLALQADSPAAPFVANGSRMARPDIQYRARPDFDGRRTELAERLQKIAEDTFGPGLNVAVFDEIHGEVGHGLSPMLGAYYDVRMPGGPLEHFVAVSLGAENAEFTLNHEGVHYLRRLGALDGKRWETLLARAPEWRRRFRIDERYPGLSEDMKNEEAIADAFAAFASGELMPFPTRPVFGRMRRFFERLRGALQGMGFRRWEDVFEEIRRGDLRPDPDGDRLGAMPRFSVAPRRGSAGVETAINKAIEADDARGVFARLRDTLADRARRVREEFVWATTDEFRGLLVTERRVRGTERDRDAFAYTAARFARHSSGQLEAFLRYGAPAWDPDEQIATFKEGSKGFFEILRPVYEQGTFRLFEGYAYARRVRSQGLIEQGREKNLTQSEVDGLLALAEQHPEFVEIFDEIQDYKKSVLDFAEQLGLVNAEQRAVWEQADHVPFYRVAEDAGATQGPGQRGALSGQSAQIRRLTGGEERFLVIDKATGNVAGRFADAAEAAREARRLGGEHVVEKGGQAIPGVVENLVRNIAHLIDASMKNHAANEAVALALEAGIATRESPRLKAERGPGSQFETALRDAGIDTTTFQEQALRAKLRELEVEVPADASLRRLKELAAKQGLDPEQFPLQAMETVFAIAPPKGLGKDTVQIKVNGRTEFYRIDDKLVYRALEGMNRNALVLEEALARPLGLPIGPSTIKRFFTRTITLSPEFGARNFQRDTLSAWALIPELGPNPAGTMLKAGTEAARLLAKGDDPRLRSIMAAGASTGWFRNAPEDVVKQMRRLQREGQVDIVDFATNPARWVKAMDSFGGALEQANRVNIYEQVLQKTGSKRAAAFEALDIMDFQLRGGSPWMQVLIQVVPFLNARVQGLYRLGRAGLGNGRRVRRAFLMKGGMIAAASIALEVWNATDEDDENGYNALPEWLKDTYYVIPLYRAMPQDVREDFGLPRFWLIPKPFEVGTIFSTIPQRMVQQVAGNDRPEEGLQAAWRAIRDTFAFDPFSNPLLSVPLEQALNRNRFLDRPIVPRREDGLDPELQFDVRFTSPLMREIGERTGLSPRRLEHIYDGFFGTLGTYVLGIADAAYRAATDAPPLPEARLDEVMFLDSLTREGPLRNTKWAERFWALKTEADQVHRTINAARRRGQREVAAEKLREGRGLLRVRGRLDSIADQLTRLRKREERIFADPDMSPEDKRDALDAIQARKNALVRRVAPLEEVAAR